MTARQSAGTPPDAAANRAPPRQRRRRRPAVRWIVYVAQAVSLGSYAQLYRRVLAALGARIRFRLAADAILATFFVSHLTPFGSATGTLVNASALEADGIAAATTGEAIALPAARVPRHGGSRPPVGRGSPRPCGSGTGPCPCAASAVRRLSCSCPALQEGQQGFAQACVVLVIAARPASVASTQARSSSMELSIIATGATSPNVTTRGAGGPAAQRDRLGRDGLLMGEAETRR
jgi:hypothetical protein